MGDKQEQEAKPGLGELLAKLIRNVRSYARAEIELAQAIVVQRVKVLRLAAAALLVGVLMSLSAILALLVGLMIGLGPIIGPFVAALAVGIGAVLIGSAIVYVSVRCIGRQLTVTFVDDAQPGEAMGTENERGQ